MRIGYIDPFPRSSATSWPRISSNFMRQLQEQGAELNVFDKHKLRPTVFDRTKQLLHRIKQERFLFERDPTLLKHMAQGIQQHYERDLPDVIISLSTLPLAYLELPCPLVFWTDSLFPGMVENYPGFSDLSDESMRNGDMADRLAMTRSALAIFTSAWAADIAKAHYVPHSPPCEVVPWGADLHQVPEQDQMRTLITNRAEEPCKLVFIGFDWERKGGPELLQIRSELIRRGVPTELIIIGSSPQIENDGTGTHVLGYLSKDVDEDNALFQHVLANAHFLVLPTRADTTAVVFAEAAAYGLPTLTSDVGGHSTVIRNGINGYTFPYDACMRTITNRIQELFNNREAYNKLALSTRKEYDERLNWQASAAKVMELLKGVVG